MIVQAEENCYDSTPHSIFQFRNQSVAESNFICSWTVAIFALRRFANKQGVGPERRARRINSYCATPFSGLNFSLIADGVHERKFERHGGRARGLFALETKADAKTSSVRVTNQCETRMK